MRSTVTVEPTATRSARCRRGSRASSGAASRSRTPQGVGDECGEQLAALDVVLYFFSGIALFVGAFLILNCFNMTVLQRMRELGHAAHARRHRGGMVMRTVMAEALVLGSSAPCSGSRSAWRSPSGSSR